MVRIVDRVLGSDGWEGFPDCDSYENTADPRDDFIDSWHRIREPMGSRLGPEQAFPLVDRWPLVSEDWPDARDASYRRTVGLCYWFARLLDDDGRFYLACRLAGKLLGLDHSQAAEYLRRAVEIDGVIEVIRKGDLATRAATEYRFRLEAVLADGPAEEEPDVAVGAVFGS